MRPRPAAHHHQRSTHGYIGLTDFRGDVIRAYIANGWHFHGEVTVNKDPQAQAIRTKSQALMFVTKNRDSRRDPAGTGRLPADLPQARRQAVPDQDRRHQRRMDRMGAASAGGTSRRPALSTPGWAARTADERHICPLQLDFIERCVRLWSNPGETVLSARSPASAQRCTPRSSSAGDGLGIELKPSYWTSAVDVMRELDEQMSTTDLFTDMDAAHEVSA